LYIYDDCYAADTLGLAKFLHLLPCTGEAVRVLLLTKKGIHSF